MSSQTFTITNVVDQSKEKEWPASLGMLDWDSTRIVFTKRSLMEFLKYAGVSVDPNYSNIAKLPRYTVFGTLSENHEAGKASEVKDSMSATPLGVEEDDPAYRPSRRVRATPGGATSDIFGLDGQDDDALASAPPAPATKHETSNEALRVSGDTSRAEVEAADEPNVISDLRPSRRVRTAPGGKDSLSELWGGDDGTADTEQSFRPTRRVRQIPGGTDNLSGIL